MRNITFSQYRAMDLTIFAVIVCVFEAVIVVALRYWFTTEVYTLSLLVPLTAIVAMRWGPYSIVHVLLANIAFCAASGADFKQYFMYVVGSCLCLVPALLFPKLLGKEELRSKWYYGVLYTALIFTFSSIGRGIAMSLLYGRSLMDSVSAHFFSDSLSLVFGILIVLVARKQDGLFEDQKSYIKRVNEEKEKQKQKI